MHAGEVSGSKVLEYENREHRGRAEEVYPSKPLHSLNPPLNRAPRSSNRSEEGVEVKSRASGGSQVFRTPFREEAGGPEAENRGVQNLGIPFLLFATGHSRGPTSRGTSPPESLDLTLSDPGSVCPHVDRVGRPSGRVRGLRQGRVPPEGGGTYRDPGAEARTSHRRPHQRLELGTFLDRPKFRPPRPPVLRTETSSSPTLEKGSDS